MEASLLALAEEGVAGVRVEALARRMGVTKGSFYWHFRDREALYEAVLDTWRRRATLDVIAKLQESGESAASRLRRLMELPLHGDRANQGAQVELAIRLWARQDARAQEALVEVDRRRLEFIAGLYEELGHAAAAARARALLTYALIRVAPSLVEGPGDLDACADALLQGAGLAGCAI